MFLLIVIWFCIPYSPLEADYAKDTEEMRAECNLYGSDEVFVASDFEDLPVVIQKYIENSGYIGKKKMSFVRMEYHDVAFSQGWNFFYFDGAISDITYDYE